MNEIPPDLAARLAAHGWALAPDPEGWVLTGNGAPAVFWRLEGLVAWLDKVEGR